MILKRRLGIALVAGTALALGACTVSDGAGGDGDHLITSFYPLEWATQQVVGDTGATIETLTKPGVDAHGLELTPQQIASMSRADLLIYLDHLQPEVDAAIPASGVERVMNVADHIELLPFAEPHSHDHDEREHTEDEGQDHDHDHGDRDPHFWVDPLRMGTVVEAIAAELTDLNPEHAEAYRSNAAATVANLQAIDAEYHEGLAECQRREFITTHTAFQYLAHRYDLVEIGISGINPDSEPSPARIAAVHDEARRHGVTTIFFETLTSPAVAESIAGDLGLKAAVLDPLEGITGNSPGEDYPSVMRANLDALRSANECN